MGDDECCQMSNGGTKKGTARLMQKGRKSQTSSLKNLVLGALCLGSPSVVFGASSALH